MRKVELSAITVTIWLVHLPERTEKGLITESGRKGPIYRIGPDCAGRA